MWLISMNMHFILPNVNINGDRGEWVALIVFLCCPLGKSSQLWSNTT